MQDIHDIRPPVTVGLDPLMVKMILIILGVVLLAGFLFFLIRKWWKKRKGTKDIEAVAIPLSPFEEAVKELESLSQRPMDDPRLFYFDLTFVLRQYMGRSFGINAVEMTSEEFIRGISRLDFEKEVKKEVSHFWSLSDPFKYAGVLAETAMVKKDIDLVREVISKIEKDLERKKEEQKNEKKEES